MSNQNKTFRIVYDDGSLVDDTLKGLSLFQAETALCRQLNLDVDCYLQEED
ncbi:hypothetical protein [Alteromonas gilva]|uniref:Uncharacterized protein n=1 Tax=Alteromonas gilva TaxID=2987522 RepID=A0ABT5L777_9ALTE|nr:hypothetical protein [Alteromonas gilva]MDC8832923.1 hypothetical protein [Alteromonas gilva]